MYDEREETDYDQSRESTSTGGNLGEFLWSSANGTVKNVKLPCRYHEGKGITAMECMSGPEHCYECSEPGHLAPPIRQCKGRHKWKPMNKRERRRRQQSWDGEDSWLTKEVVKHKIQDPAILPHVNSTNNPTDEPPDTHSVCIQSNEDKRCENPEENDSIRKCLSNTAEFYPKTEEEKEYERAAEWLEKLPLATRRSLYELECKDLPTSSAYGGKRNRGLLKREIWRDSMINLGKVITNLDKGKN